MYIFSRKIQVVSAVSLLFFVGAIALMPFFASAADPAGWSPTQKLIPCTGEIDEGGHTSCSFVDLIKLAENVIGFIIYISPFIAAIAFAVAGFKYLTAAGNTGQIAEAHKIFTSVFIGFIIILAAWLVVKTILSGLGVEGEFNLLGR